jgi:hypothetical protein
VEPQTAVCLTETAVTALQREAESAGLLVVGSRGRGAAMASRLGSTAIVLTQQSSCPVIVVPSAFGGPFDVETGEPNPVRPAGQERGTWAGQPLPRHRPTTANFNSNGPRSV